ncbi:hypothetical protein BMF94_1842 [Rhodotorula taiwanensis]|uniref:Trafficking protein particle complex subunit 2-like protein n=1 Tax=Rhodotorula taiwanensis TaxID=741276 RepID=A0A2S5BEM6_9BASI|nr:hypothetical protein BMF94_1842 [Rhodotorula taiwanensis]
MSGLAILSIAVLGKQGNPLFLESYSARRGGQADLKWHYAAHTALDFFDERGASLAARWSRLACTDSPAYKTTDSYLGMLYAMEDYAVYGYQTNTRVKFVLAIALADAVIRDIDVRTIFRAIHNAYIGQLSNPFAALDTDKVGGFDAPITNKRFAAAMATIAGQSAQGKP